MKYKTFRNLVIAFGVVAAGGAGWGLLRPSDQAAAPARLSADKAVRDVAPQPAKAAEPTAPSQNAVEQAMDKALKLPVQEKIKDATEGRPFKINLYSDDKQHFNRAKVDLDRDDRWDEKWTFKPDGTVEKQVSPADDEQYSETFVRDTDGWRKL